MNQKGIDLIKSFEGCKLKAYQDIIGVWTVGYGHTGDEVCEGLEWTQDQADQALADDVQKVADLVDEVVEVALTDCQEAALVCFAYNVGIGNLRQSTLLKKVNAKDFLGAANEFPRWDRAGGKEVPGLLRRREAERELFLS